MSRVKTNLYDTNLYSNVMKIKFYIVKHLKQSQRMFKKG